MLSNLDCHTSGKTKLSTIYLAWDNVCLDDISLVKHYQWQSGYWRRPGLKMSPVMKYRFEAVGFPCFPFHRRCLINLVTFLFQINKYVSQQWQFGVCCWRRVVGNHILSYRGLEMSRLVSIAHGCFPRGFCCC